MNHRVTVLRLLDLAQELKLNFVFWGYLDRSKTVTSHFSGMCFLRSKLSPKLGRNAPGQSVGVE